MPPRADIPHHAFPIQTFLQTPDRLFNRLSPSYTYFSRQTRSLPFPGGLTPHGAAKQSAKATGSPAGCQDFPGRSYRLSFGREPAITYPMQCFSAARKGTIMSRIRLLALLLSIPGLTGCATMLAEPRRHAVHEREDMLMFQDELRRMEGRIEALELENESLQRRAEDARRRQESERQQQASASRESAAELDRRIRALEAARERDRQEIVTHISRQMAEMLEQHRPPAAPRRPAGRQTGYEHEVRTGETLSAIAAAYGVRVRAIQEANDIADPNRLRVGQVLFIPEP